MPTISSRISRRISTDRSLPLPCPPFRLPFLAISTQDSTRHTPCPAPRSRDNSPSQEEVHAEPDEDEEEDDDDEGEDENAYGSLVEEQMRRLWQLFYDGAHTAMERHLPLLVMRD